MRRTGTLLCSALVLFFFLIAGCNVYEGLYEEGDSDDPEALYEDARLALQQNRPAEAVEHLRNALDHTEESDVLLRKQIQITLASAVLQVEDINVLSLRRMITTFNDAPLQTTTLGKVQNQVCLFPPAYHRTPFDPATSIDVEHLNSPDGEAALAESQALIARVFAAEATTPAPVFACSDSALDAGIAALQGQGLAPTAIAEALVDYAVARSTEAYLNIMAAGNGEATFFHVTSPTGDRYVGQCFSSTPTCNRAITETLRDLTLIDCTTRVLQRRAALLGSSSAQELADEARTSYESLAFGIDNAVCLAHEAG